MCKTATSRLSNFWLIGDYKMTMSERLKKLARVGDGEISVAPEEGLDLEAFQTNCFFPLF
jgi:hypothetical protein